MEHVLMKHMDDLEYQKLEALAEFAAGAGHEINNPLAIISGRTKMLLQEIEHPEHRRHLAIISAQVHRAYEMIADIRFFAKPPAPEWKEFCLTEELKTLVEEQNPLMEENEVSFHADIESPEESLVWSDPVLLHLAVSILCNNARESVAFSQGRIWLRLQQTESGWEITVQDNGQGVSDEIRPLIFNPYYSGRSAGRGLGFGLPKAWRIMQLLGGSIRHEPTSIFILSLPNAPPTAEPPGDNGL